MADIRLCRRWRTNKQEENAVVSQLTGFSLQHVLQGLELPSGAEGSLSNRLGISGIPSLSAKQIYSDRWDEEEDAIGADQGEDFEDEVNRELENENENENENDYLPADDEENVKAEAQSPAYFRRERRKKIIRRLVERPKAVHERFPAFEHGKILDFTELIKGNVVRKSRIGKRPFEGVSTAVHTQTSLTHFVQWRP